MFNRSFRLFFTLLSLLVLSCAQIVEPHGFASDTLITMKNGKELMPLYRLANLIVMSTWKRVTAYDAVKKKWAKRCIEGVGFSEADSYCRLFFLNDPSPIVCSSIQPFYRLSDKQWVEVYKLRSGDTLLCRDNESVTVSKIVLVQEPLRVCTLQVKSAHTFLVGKQGVVTHNSSLPLGAFIRFSLPFGAAGAGAGISFGPIGITVGALLCGAVGIMYDLHRREAYATYHCAEGQKTVAVFAQVVTKNHGETAVSGGTKQKLGAAPRQNLYERVSNDCDCKITDCPGDFTQNSSSNVESMHDVPYGCAFSSVNEVPDEVVNITDSLHRSFKKPSGGSMHEETVDHFVCGVDQQEQLIIEENENCNDFKQSEFEAALYDYECKNSDQLGLRKELIEQIKNNGAVYECRSYEIATPVGDLLQHHNCDIAAYNYFYGDQLQQLAHQECVHILEKIVDENYFPSLPVQQQNFSKGLVGCVDAAREYNQIGLPEKSFYIIDFCYAFLDCGVDIVKGVLEGTAKGLVGAVRNCIEHPIETVACVVAGKYVFAYHLLHLLENVAEVSVDGLRAYNAGQKEWDGFLKPVKKHIKELSQQKISLCGAVEGTTAFVVHWVAQNKLHGGLNDIFKAAKAAVKAKAVALVNKIQSAPDQVLTTPEGVSFSTSADSKLPANNNALAKQAHASKQQHHTAKQHNGKQLDSNANKQQTSHQQDANPRQQQKREIGAPRYPNKWYRSQAEKLGYRLDKNPPFNTYRQLAFRKGNQWISPDATGHKGGAWKVFDRKVGRWATYNEDLTIEIGA